MMTVIRPFAAKTYRRMLRVGYGLREALGLKILGDAPVKFITEGANWTIHWVGESYVSGVETLHPGVLELSDTPYKHHDRILHFGSQFHWHLWADIVSPTNKALVTFFHGKPDDGPEMKSHIDYFLNNMDRIDRIVTAATLIERRLLSWGVPREKLVHVPLGVDCGLFVMPDEKAKRQIRAALGIPEDTVCIGSFQKDGIGWGRGLEPKSIKGPDLFVEAMDRLAKEFPVHVLLTGPARGYVMSELDRRDIPYHHIFHDRYEDIVPSYQALDLYLVTSREEGGPQALLESMACGVPLVSTRVGMAEDVIEDGVNGYLADVDDLEGLVTHVGNLLSQGEKAEAFKRAGRTTAEAYDWAIVSERLYEKAYRDFLA